MSNLPFWTTELKPGYPQVKTSWVEIGDGIKAYLAMPTEGTAPFPAMILGHERYGLVLDTLEQTAKFAAYGYVCIAPDMVAKFEGDKEALAKGHIMGGWDNDIVREYMTLSYDFVVKMPEVDTKKIAAIGLCASGHWPWLLNAERPDLAACICYYGGGPYNEELMDKVTAPTLYVYGEKDHTTPISRVFNFRDEMERHHKSCEIRLEPDMHHGWLNDTMAGRYRQKEAQEAWDRIIEFMERVFAGYYSNDRVKIRFEADFARDYDFKKLVRWGELPYPEPDVASINTLKAKVASGELPPSEIDRMETLYSEFFNEHPHLKPSNA